MSRVVVVALVFVAMPFALTVARSVFAPEAAAAVVKPRELTAFAEAEALPRRYGLEIVAMPEVPGAEFRFPNSDVRSPTSDVRSSDTRDVGLTCPDIRAIVSGDSPFAIIAWDDVSQVVKPAQTIGDLKVRRITSQSITFAKADTTLQCKLSVR